jgi:sporulation protein YlmC with PRC-barrel domain
MDDPVSWLQIEQGWRVVASDGTAVGTVAQVEGDKESDIFDGLAVSSGEPSRLLYVPGEQVGAIHPGEVTLKIASAEASTLGEFRPPPPETELRPRRQPLTTRLTNWLRGQR